MVAFLAGWRGGGGALVTAAALVALVGRGLLGEDEWAAACRFVSGGAFACANAVNQIG